MHQQLSLYTSLVAAQSQRLLPPRHLSSFNLEPAEQGRLRLCSPSISRWYTVCWPHHELQLGQRLTERCLLVCSAALCQGGPCDRRRQVSGGKKMMLQKGLCTRGFSVLETLFPEGREHILALNEAHTLAHKHVHERARRHMCVATIAVALNAIDLRCFCLVLGLDLPE